MAATRLNYLQPQRNAQASLQLPESSQQSQNSENPSSQMWMANGEKRTTINK